MRRCGVLLATLAIVVACSDEPEIKVPAVAPATRHAELDAALSADADQFAFVDGDWLEDLGDGTFFGLAWLTRRAAAQRLSPDGIARRDAAVLRAKALLEGPLLEGEIQDRIMAAFGMIEHIDATKDRTLLPVLDAFIGQLDAMMRVAGDYITIGEEQSWALRTYGPTAITALIGLIHAQYALLIGGDARAERIERALAIDAKIRERALTDLFDPGGQARAYAFAPGVPGIYDYPNAAMLLLKARLFRLTNDEVFRLEARSMYVALRALKLSDSPARFSSPYAKASLGIETRDLSTLSSQNYIALALMLLFEITDDKRFIDEADRVLDGIAAMRGPWCRSQVIEKPSEERCTTGLLHHVVNGRLALPEDGTLFCAGCNLQTLYVLGYRRSLARQPY